MSHPDWITTHHGTTTTQRYIGEGEPTVPQQFRTPTCSNCGADLSVMRIAACCSNPHEDAALNRLADERADGPFVAVSLDDLTAPQEAEPVAWLWTRGGDLELTLLLDGEYGKRLSTVGFTSSPLYTHPAPAPAVPQDADQLRAEITRLTAERDTARAEVAKWQTDANLMLGFADLAYDVGVMPTSSELIAARDRVLEARDKATREAALREAQPAPQVKALAEAAIRDCAAGAPISAANLARDILSAMSGEAQR